MQYKIFKISLSVLAAAVLLLSGCISEDLTECPPPAREEADVWISLSFTMHNEESEEDLFAQTAKKTDLFIFDKAGLLVQHKVALGPFTEEYKIRTSLPAGEYQAVAWANIGTNNAKRLHPVPEVGKTNITEPRVQLIGFEEGLVTVQPDALLYGQTGLFSIAPATEREKIIEIAEGMICSSNSLKFSVRWKDNTTGEPSIDTTLPTSTRIYVDADNGALDFNNIPASAGKLVTYVPRYPAPTKTGANAATLTAQSKVLRLMPGQTNILRVCRVNADGSETTVFTRALMDYILPIYPTQRAIDRQQEFHIELLFDTEPPQPGDDTWITASVYINGWKIIDNGDSELD